MCKTNLQIVLENPTAKTLTLKCIQCNQNFVLSRRNIWRTINNKNRKNDFCSKKCSLDNRASKNIKVICLNCDKEFYKLLNQIKKSPNHFCSTSCAATYNNRHKTKGTRRSKLEKFLELELIKTYTNIEFNKINKIGYELDIYFTDFNTAFEINGIFHYKAIYGQEKFNKIQEIDKLKLKLCKENNINLIIIDISYIKHFNIKDATDVLNYIKTIVPPPDPASGCSFLNTKF